MTAENTRTETSMPDMTPERWECPHCDYVLDGIAENSDVAGDVMTKHTEHCRPHEPWLESDPALAIPGCRAMGCQAIGDVAAGTPDGSGLYGAVSANAYRLGEGVLLDGWHTIEIEREMQPA